MKDTLINGRYLIIDPIGSGGEARVFRARDVSGGTEVAVRLGQQTATYTPRAVLPPFHPGWTWLLDSGIDPQYGAYHVYELLIGQTLNQLVQIGPLNPEYWRLFVDQSLDAVSALHAAGWLHGDLNADNFFYTYTADRRWKLLELPFLRFDPPPDRSNLFGSIHTLPPEKFDGSPLDARSDLFSLGCLYYFAACGQYPHLGNNAQEIAIARLQFIPVHLSEKAPWLPTGWSRWVMTLLERYPQYRFPTIPAASQLLKIA